MKIGTFLLLFLAVGGYLLWKYSGHLKRLFAASATPSGTAKSVKDLIAKYALSILLVVVGLVIFFQGVYSSEWQSPSFALVGSWSWAHWLQLLVLWGIGSALLALNKKALGAAVPVLQSLLTGMVVMAFLVCPVIGWIEGFGTPNHQVPQPAANAQSQLSIPLASSPQSSWPKLVISANGKSELIPVPVDMHILMAGNKFLNHNVYQDGHECVFGEPCVAGPLKGNYATNETSEKNIVSYAFAPN